MADVVPAPPDPAIPEDVAAQGRQQRPRRRNGNNNDNSMVEMITLFPHEFALLMRRGIEMGCFFSCLLVTHCITVTIKHWESELLFDNYLRFLSLLRVLCAFPRPYYWAHTRADFIEARFLATPQLVSRRLLQIYNRQSRLEQVLFIFYYSWLICMSLLTLLVPVNPSGIGTTWGGGAVYLEGRNETTSQTKEFENSSETNLSNNFTSEKTHDRTVVSQTLNNFSASEQKVIDKVDPNFFSEHVLYVPSGYSSALWQHCILCLASLVVHRFLCVSLFYYFMHSDLKRGIPEGVINHYSTILIWDPKMRFEEQFMKWSNNIKTTGSSEKQNSTEEILSQSQDSGLTASGPDTSLSKTELTTTLENSQITEDTSTLRNRALNTAITCPPADDDDDEADCIVCYGGFSTGERIRKLRCGHLFHEKCVDTWLLQHQNKCPMCSAVIGPVSMEEYEMQ